MRLNKAGDTIVEVMVVLTILGLALSISYATVNRSLLSTRQAEENSIATELAQSQIEEIRLLAANTTAAPSVFATGNFCIVPSGSSFNRTFGLSCATSAVPDGTITDSWDNGANDTFTVTVQWPDVFGDNTDTVTLFYRVHPPSS
jgi:type II secretory pathway pseudopilin PulG